MRFVFAMLSLVAVLATTPACSRRVDVETGVPQSDITLSVTNNANQAVNVYVVSGGTPIFVGQISPGRTQNLTVNGVATGSIVTLRATTTDGTRTYTKDNVELSGATSWEVP
jgi:hypothetical protein